MRGGGASNDNEHMSLFIRKTYPKSNESVIFIKINDICFKENKTHNIF